MASQAGVWAGWYSDTTRVAACNVLSVSSYRNERTHPPAYQSSSLSHTTPPTSPLQSPLPARGGGIAGREGGGRGRPGSRFWPMALSVPLVACLFLCSIEPSLACRRSGLLDRLGIALNKPRLYLCSPSTTPTQTPPADPLLPDQIYTRIPAPIVVLLISLCLP